MIHLMRICLISALVLTFGMPPASQSICKSENGTAEPTRKSAAPANHTGRVSTAEGSSKATDSSCSSTPIGGGGGGAVIGRMVIGAAIISRVIAPYTPPLCPQAVPPAGPRAAQLPPGTRTAAPRSAIGGPAIGSMEGPPGGRVMRRRKRRQETEAKGDRCIPLHHLLPSAAGCTSAAVNSTLVAPAGG